MKGNKILLYALYVIVIAALVYVGYITKGFGIWKEKATTTSKNSEWQAVFLTNGQVYFGKLSGVSSDFVTLKDIYYLQVQNAVQPASGQSSTDQSKVSLIKLGNELHGPMDEMKINRTQVLFYENLKADGKVVQAIDKYIKDGPAASATPTASPAQ